MKTLLIILLFSFQAPVKNYRLVSTTENKHSRLMNGSLIVYSDMVRVSEDDVVITLKIDTAFLNFHGSDVYFMSDTVPVVYRSVMVITKTPNALKPDVEEGFIFIEIRTAECMVELRYRYKRRV